MATFLILGREIPNLGTPESGLLRGSVLIGSIFHETANTNQYISKNGAWHERNINYKNYNLHFEIGKQIRLPLTTNPNPEGKIIEDGIVLIWKTDRRKTFTSNQFPILSMEKTKEGASDRVLNIFK